MDAGFPIIRGDWDEKIPTLSELIEACGVPFDCLLHYEDGFTATGGDVKGDGKIPEESVANLWLALNKK